ncbi:hypothetical protein AB7M42_001898 [Bradyrhizobium diazoefficiens]|nr:hypothetical protein CO678_20775 [Bradyrhizobium diazoefficiens]QBP27342.1 hypothetical protein Bdiaspc4_37510 [Bradyrhizobium diazoefficiens]BBZ97915.1 hypothetical protein F07S3_77480 [Bradyrhizobium diazoefficiens]BCE42456.1 hypothetical protein XF3B_74870 [Bradyrhizobium diazoefficiens]BCE94768.1 hypothetical protein XF10B_75660 [Bradyrhizobium diazoefficiens]
MQCIDRRVEISVFLLQPGELGFEFTLVFMGHVCGGRKTDSREIKAVDALWKLSSLRAVTASDLGPSLTHLSQDISTVRCGAAQAH